MHMPAVIYAITPLVYFIFGVIGIFHTGVWYGVLTGIILMVISLWIVKSRIEHRTR